MKRFQVVKSTPARDRMAVAFAMHNEGFTYKEIAPVLGYKSQKAASKAAWRHRQVIEREQAFQEWYRQLRSTIVG